MPTYSAKVGRPAKRTQQAEAQVLGWFLHALVSVQRLPSDQEAGEAFEMCPRLIRQIRLDHGLDRRQIASWQKEQAKDLSEGVPFVAYSPYAGIFLILAVVLQSAWKHTLRALKMPVCCAICAHQFVLTLIGRALVGLRRLYHIQDVRHHSDVGLALFTGRARLLSDSTLWKILHHLSKEAIDAFHMATSCTQIFSAPFQVSASRISFDDHVVPSFTRLKPCPLKKTRVASRGRSLPSVRLYFTWDLDQGDFLGLTVTDASQRLSQILPGLIAQLRTLKAQAGHPTPRKLFILFDRGGYKGTVFEILMADPDLDFLTPACTYPTSVRQWEKIPPEAFVPFVLPNEETLPKEQQTPLQVAYTQTTIQGCSQPIPSIVIRDERTTLPEGVPRWRVFFSKTPTWSARDAFRTYHTRQDHERGYRSFKWELPGDVLPKAYGLLREPNQKGQKRHTIGTKATDEDRKEVLFMGWIHGLTFNLIRQFGERLGPPYQKMRPGSLLRKFILRPGRVILSPDVLEVVLEPFTEAHALTPFLQEITRQNLTIPWLGHRRLVIRVAEQAMGTADNLPLLKHLISANLSQRKAA